MKRFYAGIVIGITLSIKGIDYLHIDLNHNLYIDFLSQYGDSDGNNSSKLFDRIKIKAEYLRRV